MSFSAKQNPPNWSTNETNKRKCDSNDDSVPNKIPNTSTVTTDKWYRFIVLSPNTDATPLTKISPFLIQNSIQACAGEVKKVTKMKSGSLLIECLREQQ